MSLVSSIKKLIFSVVDPTINKKLLLAAQSRDLSVVNRLLKNGADINSVDEFGWTPLMIAAAEGIYLPSFPFQPIFGQIAVDS